VGKEDPPKKRNAYTNWGSSRERTCGQQLRKRGRNKHGERKGRDVAAYQGVSKTQNGGGLMVDGSEVAKGKKWSSEEECNPNRQELVGGGFWCGTNTTESGWGEKGVVLGGKKKTNIEDTAAQRTVIVKYQ